MNTNIQDEKSSKQQESISKFKETYEDVSENSSKDNYDRYKNGRWQPAEHLRFIKGCLLYGNNWKKVSFYSCLISLTRSYFIISTILFFSFF